MHPKSSTLTVRFVLIKSGYCVGDDGSVWSCVKWSRKGLTKYGQWRRLRPSPQYRGHMTVWMGREDQRFVHRLVLEAFVGPCPNGMECRHLDGDPSNNALDNLCWGTRLENHRDSVRHGTAVCLRPQNLEHASHLWDHVKHKSGEKHHRAKLTDEQVAIIKATVDTTKRNGTVARLAKEWGVSQAIIRMIARGIRRTGTD